MKRTLLIVAVCIGLAGCDDGYFPVCTPETAATAGERFAQCLRGDGEYRVHSRTCADRAMTKCTIKR